MPSQIVNAAALRASGYSIRAYASFITGGTPVATGSVTYAPEDSLVTKEDIQINFATGAWTDLAYGMEVVFTDSLGNFKGRTHIRYDGNGITSTSIPVREYWNPTLLLEIGDKYAAYKEWRLHDKLVAANALFPPDGLPYSDQGSNPPPVACSGGHWAGNLDAGQSYATVLTKGDTSYTVDPDSAGSVTHLWTLPSGVTFAPGSASTDANPTLRVTAGEYTVYHAVTDSGNSKTTVQHIHLKAHNPATNPPHKILYTPDTATADSGFGGTVRIVSGATTQAAIPDGCLCIIWGVEYVNGQQVSYRNSAPGRAHILCTGIVRRDRQSGDQDGSRVVEFEIISPLARLKEITSYSKVMEQNATPDDWSQIKTLSVKRAIIQLIQFYTTLIEAGFDFTFDSAFIDYLYPALYLNRSDFYAQVAELTLGVDGRMVCDRTGRFNLHTDPKLIPEDERAAITKTWRFIPKDILSFDFPREHVDTVEQMLVSGVSGGLTGNSDYYSHYPGGSPGEAVGTPTRDRLILNPSDPQGDINERAGRHGAVEDVIFQDADGLRYRAFPLTLVMRGVYDFFDFSKEYVDFTTTLPDLARDVDLTKFLFCLASTSVSYDAEFGTATTTCVFDVVTHAAPGESFFPPDESLNYPSYEYPLPQYTTLPSATDTGILGRGTANLALFDMDNPGYWFLRLSDGAVEFVDMTALATPLQGSLVMFILDAYDTRAGIVITSTHAYRIDDFHDDMLVALANEYAFAHATAYRSMQSERLENGFFVVVSNNEGGDGIDVEVSTDGGQTWTRYNNVFGTWTGGSGDELLAGVYVDPNTVGRVLTAGWTGAGVTSSRLKVSTDHAASWANLDGNTMSHALAGDIHSPYLDSSVVFHGGNTGSGQPYRVYRSVGGVRTDLSPTVSAEVYGTFLNQFAIKSCDSDPRFVLFVLSNANASKWGVWLAQDGALTSASLQVIVPPTTTVPIRGGTITADKTIFLWGVAALWVSYDLGQTFLDKSAGLVAGGAGRIANIAGVDD